MRIDRPRLYASLALAFFFGCTAAAAQDSSIGDEAIEHAIEEELQEARATDADSITVGVSQGIATLTGEVDHILAKDRAVRIAQMTRGVVSVVDQLTVEDAGRSDDAIARNVEQALAEDPATDSWDIAATVTGGAVTLTGTAELLICT